MASPKASEELLAAPLPDLVRELGLAVATANKELQGAGTPDMRFTVDQAEVELKVAISIDKGWKGEVKGGAAVSVFNVNASYARTFNYKEEASSRILLHFAARPRSEGESAESDG